jgi:hypothetical protein
MLPLDIPSHSLIWLLTACFFTLIRGWTDWRAVRQPIDLSAAIPGRKWPQGLSC